MTVLDKTLFSRAAMVDYLVNAVQPWRVDPVLHPEGFAQVKLTTDGAHKLHVWDPRLPRLADANTIHDHVWDMDSYVLAGTQVNQEFIRLYADGPPPEADIDELDEWERWEVVGGDRVGKGGTAIAPTGERVYLAGLEPYRIPEGQTYTFGKGRLHRSLADGVTATYMVKYNRSKHDPRVYARVGEVPDRDDVRPANATPDFLWGVILEALA